ncbi:ABC transporter permease [Clostridiaceae bacterium OttesenSCG-928-D20]|nr:ABC transporter permease [Clostridiaceae bacterium OttesenSCG-928-D20]
MDKITFVRYLQLIKIHAKMDFASLLRDTKFMLIAILSDIFADISSISGVFLLAWRFDGIGGLDKFEILFMLAYSSLVSGVIGVFDCTNASFPSRIIGRGQWEHMFIMPLPYSTQLLSGFSPFTCSGRLISGLVLMSIAAVNLGGRLPLWWVFALIGNIIISIVIVVGLSYLVSSLAFYAPVQCEEISSTLRQSLSHCETFPLSGMPQYIKMPLLTVFPAGLIAWLPTIIILGKTAALVNIYPLLFALLVYLAAAHFFKKGFRYYVKTGINRYHPGGHRG